MVCVGGLRRKSSTLCFFLTISNLVDDMWPSKAYVPRNFFISGSAS